MKPGDLRELGQHLIRLADTQYPPDTFNAVGFQRTKYFDRRVLALDQALNQFEVNVPGDFIYLDQNSTGIISYVLDSNDPNAPAMPAGANWYQGGVPYRKLYITSAAQPGKIVNLWYGWSAHFTPPNSAIQSIGSIINPVTVGSVTNPVEVKPVPGVPDIQASTPVVNGGMRTAENISFAFIDAVVSAAGQYPQIQFWNPLGTGKNAYFNRLEIGSGSSGYVGLSITNAQIAGVLKAAPQTKYAGAALASVVQIYSLSAAALASWSFGGSVQAGSVPPAILLAPGDDPIAIPPGYGLILQSATAADTIDVVGHWYEQ